jgi:hypothetical protein
MHITYLDTQYQGLAARGGSAMWSNTTLPVLRMDISSGPPARAGPSSHRVNQRARSIWDLNPGHDGIKRRLSLPTFTLTPQEQEWCGNL